MPRKKRWSIRFELAPELEDDVRLFEFLKTLSASQERSEWLRTAALEQMDRVDTPLINMEPEKPLVDQHVYQQPTVKVPVQTPLPRAVGQPERTVYGVPKPTFGKSSHKPKPVKTDDIIGDDSEYIPIEEML